jgi:RNA polymerase sigma factor (sigma-70 family)
MQELIEQHYLDNRRKLVKRLSFAAGDCAEDVVQEAYYRALKYSKSYKPEFTLDKWLNQILNNCLKEHKNTERGFSSVTFEEEDQEGIACTGMGERIIAEIDELISTKSLVQIEVLTYAMQQGYTAKEISELTEYTYANCHQIVHRFRQELRELYGKD